MNVRAYIDQLKTREWRPLDYKRVGVVVLLGEIDVPREFVGRVQAYATNTAASLSARVARAGPDDVLAVHNDVIDFKKWSDVPIANERLLERKMNALPDFQNLVRTPTTFGAVWGFCKRHGEDVFGDEYIVRQWKRRVDETYAVLVNQIGSMGEHDFYTAGRLQREIDDFRTYSDRPIDDAKVLRVVGRVAQVSPFRLGTCSHLIS